MADERPTGETAEEIRARLARATMSVVEGTSPEEWEQMAQAVEAKGTAKGRRIAAVLRKRAEEARARQAKPKE
jgi:hypothetical protein